MYCNWMGLCVFAWFMFTISKKIRCLTKSLVESLRIVEGFFLNFFNTFFPEPFLEKISVRHFLYKRGAAAPYIHTQQTVRVLGTQRCTYSLA